MWCDGLGFTLERRFDLNETVTVATTGVPGPSIHAATIILGHQRIELLEHGPAPTGRVQARDSSLVPQCAVSAILRASRGRRASASKSVTRSRTMSSFTARARSLAISSRVFRKAAEIEIRRFRATWRQLGWFAFSCVLGVTDPLSVSLPFESRFRVPPSFGPLSPEPSAPRWA
ncbi:hypothetical protein [Rothia uropygioeca]|uniref:hypothetical protein n=1 Tax=Kocuria sp. 257 TaxID=2021970 RepID=UPI003426607F